MLRYLSDYKRESVLAPLFKMLEATFDLFVPLVMADIVNVGIAAHDFHYILVRCGILLLLAIVGLACSLTAQYFSATAALGFGTALRRDLYRHIDTLSYSELDGIGTPTLVTRMTTDVANVQMAFMMLIRTAVRSPLMLIFSVVMATVMGGWLALTFAVVIPLLALGFLLISRKAMPAFHRVFRKYDALNESIEENVRGMRVVKGFSREEYEKEKFAGAADAITEDFTKAERIVAFNTPLMNFCMYFNMVFILLIGSLLAIKHPETGINIGQISALLNYGMAVLMSLMMLSMIYVMLTISAESMRRIVEVLDEVPDMKAAADPVDKIPDGSVDFENVSFKYSASAEAYALADVNLHIPSGATVGIIGGTGSSKSTLVQLIPRLYDVSEGTIRVGGVDVRDYDLNVLRDGVAMVLQKNLLFAGTIRENLRWGNPDATDAELEEACRLAQADEFVRAFPDGYDTHIEQGGTNVSGGQKQRLCIARAILRRPKVLILDDSTSAVDTATDAKIRGALKTALPGATKLIIAQRITSVMDADMILVLDDGRVVGQGTHAQLMESCEIYREVYESQQEGVSIDG